MLRHDLVDPQRLDRSRPEVVQEQVGVRGQASQQGVAVIGPQVDHEAALVAVDRCEIGAPPIRWIAPERRTPSPRLVAGGRLELPDVGPQVAEQHRRERPGQNAAEVQDADPGQGQRRSHVPERY